MCRVSLLNQKDNSKGILWMMKNVMIQVIETNSELTNQIENVLLSSIETFKIYFMRVNHVCFSHPINRDVRFSNEEDILDPLLSALKFNFIVGDQCFSNINQIVNFCVDNIKSHKNEVEPEQVVLDEVEYEFMKNIYQEHCE